jgi:hypothetical protein
VSAGRRRIHTDLDLVRQVLADRDATSQHAASVKHGIHASTIRKWADRRAVEGPDWPTVEDVAEWRADEAANGPSRRRNAERALRRMNRVYLQGGNDLVDATGTIRRLQALVFNGFTYPEIAEELGVDRTCVGHLIHDRPTVHRRTAAAVAALYDRWSMTIPVDDDVPRGRGQVRVHERQRGLARRHGWAGPLAWDDDTIDDPTAAPHGVYVATRPRTEVDEAVVDLILSGRMPACRVTKAERLEVTRRWVAEGRSLASLARLTGWREHRYAPERAA